MMAMPSNTMPTLASAVCEFLILCSGEKEEDEVLMTIETPPSDTVSAIPASGQQEEKGPVFEVETVEDEEYRGPEIEPYNPCLDLENYHYPTIDLMKHYDNAEPTIDMAEQNANKDEPQ